MPRPNSFWDVLSETANYASEAIPAAQQQNRQMAQDQERFGLRAQQERDRLGETKRYHDEMLGLRGREVSLRESRAQNPTSHPSFDQVYADILQNPGKYDPQVVQDFKEAAAERHPGPREPKEKEPPNFIGGIRERAGKLMTQNAGIRRQESTTVTPTATNPGGTYGVISTPALTDSAATEQAYGEVAGEFPRYNVKPDSIRAGLGFRPPQPRQIGAPSSNMGDLRRMESQPTGGYGPDGSFPTEEEYLEAKAMGIVQ